MSLPLGTALHALALVDGLSPRHGEHVRDTFARALGRTQPAPLRLRPPEGTKVHGAIICCPSASAAYKQWAADRWNTLIDALRDERRTVVIAPDTCSVNALSALIGGASLVIAVDSGALHLADALGIPVIGLYAATSALTYGPYTQRERCIDKHREASDALGLPYDSSRHLSRANAMDRISVSDVLQRIHAHA